MKEGYITDEELFEQNKTKYTDTLFYIYRTMMDGNYTSFNTAEETDILAYIEYLIFCLDNPREDKESEVNE